MKKLKSGDIVRLISYHKDNRPVLLSSIDYIGNCCVLKEPRCGYYNWSIYDIEECKEI